MDAHAVYGNALLRQKVAILLYIVIQAAIIGIEFYDPRFTLPNIGSGVITVILGAYVAIAPHVSTKDYVLEYYRIKGFLMSYMSGLVLFAAIVSFCEIYNAAAKYAWVIPFDIISMMCDAFLLYSFHYNL